MSKFESLLNESTDSDSYGLKWSEFDNKDRVVNKQKFFSTEKERQSFADKLEDKDSFKKFLAWSEPKNEAAARGMPDKGNWDQVAKSSRKEIESSLQRIARLADRILSSYNSHDDSKTESVCDLKNLESCLNEVANHKYPKVFKEKDFQ